MVHKLTPADAAELLALAAAFDRRTVGQADAAAWADALYDLEPEDCAEAVRLHYRESTAWIMPGHVRQRVSYLKTARADRLHDIELRREIESGNAADRDQVRKIASRLIRDVQVELGETPLTGEQAGALTVRCPYCRAEAGRSCVNAASDRERVTPHPSRIDALTPAP